MIRSFANVADCVNENWRRLGRARAHFSDAAASALEQTGILKKIAPEHIIDWLGRCRQIPEQHAKPFGQPSINVYVNDEFYIQVLFWIDGTTGIHDHGFTGAFGVLAGSSVHTQYRFQLSKDLSDELRLGRVAFVSSEILRQGDVRPIRSGEGFIHSLFHLDRPSVSVVIRSDLPPRPKQYAYVKPYIAFDPLLDNNICRVQLRLLESLNAAGEKALWKYAGDLLKHASPWMCFNVLLKTCAAGDNYPAQFRHLEDFVAERFGVDVLQCFIESIREDLRSWNLYRLRSSVHSPLHRFMLGLILNVPDRRSLLALVSRQFTTAEPELLVSECIREMTEEGIFRTKLDEKLLEIIYLAVEHGSFDNAREAGFRSQSGANSCLREDGVRDLWQSAACSIFRPLFL